MGPKRTRINRLTMIPRAPHQWRTSAERVARTVTFNQWLKPSPYCASACKMFMASPSQSVAARNSATKSSVSGPRMRKT